MVRLGRGQPAGAYVNDFVSVIASVPVTSVLTGTLQPMTGAATGDVSAHATVTGTLPTMTGSITTAAKVKSTAFAGALQPVTGSITRRPRSSPRRSPVRFSQ